MKKTVLNELRLLLLILWIGWIIFACIQFLGSMYQYTIVTNWELLVKTICCLFVVPTLLMVLNILLIKRGKTALFALCGVIFCFTLVISFFHSGMLLTFTPVFSSYTDDPSHFGIYDEAVRQELESNKTVQEMLGVADTGYFPETIPQYAKDIQYCYFYQNSSYEQIYIAVGWTCSEEEFSKISTVYSNYPSINDNNSICVYHFPEYRSKDGYAYLPTAVILNKEANRVAYVIANWGAVIDHYLPKSMEDVFSFPFRTGDGSPS